MIEAGGTAPYAPKSAVIGFIRAYRDKPIQGAIDLGVLTRIGVADTIAPRTLQALKLLDLVDDSGVPTQALQDLRKAPTEAEYKDRLAEIVRAAYADVFTYRDPTTDSPEEIEGAFRSYEPHGMRSRMASLFRGLCAEAGIIEETHAPRVTRITKTVGGGRSRGQRQALETRIEPAPLTEAAPAPGALHPFIQGLVSSLPTPGDQFPEEKQEAWFDTARGIFRLIYAPTPERANPGGNTLYLDLSDADTSEAEDDDD